MNSYIRIQEGERERGGGGGGGGIRNNKIHVIFGLGRSVLRKIVPEIVSEIVYATRISDEALKNS